MNIRKKIKKLVAIIGIFMMLFSFSPVAFAGDGAFVGEIVLFPYNFAPIGWAKCDGQIIPIAQNTALFSLIGTKYGGNGTTTFALPDLNGTEPWGPYAGRYCICLQGLYPQHQ